MNQQTTATEITWIGNSTIKSSNRSIILCILWDSCHELFCVFGDSYLPGTQDAEVTNHWASIYIFYEYLNIEKIKRFQQNYSSRQNFWSLCLKILSTGCWGGEVRGSIPPSFPYGLWIAWLPQTPSVSQSMDGRVWSNRIFMPHFQILSHSFNRPPYKKICNSKKHF